MAESPDILVIGPSWVGDMVMAQCLLKTLRARSETAAIDVLAPPATAPLVIRMPEARRAIVAPFHHGGIQLRARWRIARSLAGAYGEAFVLPGSLKAALVPVFAGIPKRTGHLGERRYGLINHIIPLVPDLRRQTARIFQALAGPDGEGELHLPALRVDAANRDRLAAEHGLAGRPYVALAPGAEFGPAKRWPAEHYAAVARHHLANGRAVVIIGSPGDKPAGESVVAAAPGVLNLCGATTLLDAVDLLSGAELAITNDSGLMHIAAAVGTPLVAVYGSTVPDHTPPLSPRAVTVTLRLDCAPCFSRTCPLGHQGCLTGLSPDSVIAAGESLGLAGRAGRLGG